MPDLSSLSWFAEQNERLGTGVSLRVKHKVVEKQSPFHKVEVYNTTDFGYLMVIDNYPRLSSQDSFFYHEMMVHPAMLTHPNPQNVLIIGGENCGCLQQVLKHQAVRSVKQVYSDSLVSEVAHRYFPELSEHKADERAQLLFEEHRQSIKRMPERSIDVIIVDLIDAELPSCGALDDSFYQDCMMLLNENGLLVAPSGSPLLQQAQIKTMRENMLAAGFRQVETLLFPLPIYPSGQCSCTLATKGAGFNNIRFQDAQHLSQQLKYYSADTHKLSGCLPNYLTGKL
ncbi:spermidine synthase [Catenovulum agarivorans DS-2]|uniref:Polyamine aminopropyltransferase n=1 Tax=Catenovulum agarivorans DS-2 TaxID=1328313 RepID=W7QI45_9ALTE|nr:spermidine synthase [Catenovulum agarivorans]EWH11551.1 spermidine synthase [Catenovulum agarivorans DS-2]